MLHRAIVETTAGASQLHHTRTAKRLTHIADYVSDAEFSTTHCQSRNRLVPADSRIHTITDGVLKRVSPQSENRTSASEIVQFNNDLV